MLALDEPVQDKLTEEFLDFQLASAAELPKWTEGETDVGTFWGGNV